LGTTFGVSILGTSLPSPLGKTILHVASPVAPQDFEEPGSDHLRIVVDGPLTDADAVLVAEYAKRYQRCVIVLGMRYDAEPFELGFLEHFPFLYGFDLLSHWFDKFSDLELLPSSLQSLDLGDGTKRLSLRILERFANLRVLGLDGHRKNIDSIACLTKMEDLTLRSISLPNLDYLLPMKRLRSLDIKLGGTRNLNQVASFTTLKYLEVWQVKGLSDLGFMGDATSLEHVFLQSLKQVTQLPSFGKLTRLKRVELEQMSGVSDLAPVADAPALEELVVSHARHLRPEDFRPFVGHPTLRAASIGLGSIRRNEQVQSLLGLPLV
jgi:hypothetical protein